jgi:hypothetical protein
MARYSIEDTTLSSIATAIRSKNGLTDTYKPADMPQAIMSLETGGGGGDLPEEAFHITGDCQYRFRSNGWNWFAEKFGNRVTTQDITNCAYMFYESNTLTKIPFDINIKPNAAGITSLTDMFSGCNRLANIPKINFTTPLDAAISTSSGAVILKNMFNDCYDIKEIDYDIFNNMFTEKYAEEALLRGGANFARAYMFDSCLSLRRHPDLSRVMTGATGNNNIYYYMFNSCSSIDEIVNLPVHPASSTSNMFSSTFNSCQRLKRLTFATQADGTPYARTWKSQTIDLSSKVGWGMVTNNGLGFYLETWVRDEETYQARKDNPDYWASSADYSRYNKVSAIETINTLPDVSAGSGNTIKFTGAAGSATDGGAINTMTQEEIAVATAKGWTVSFA